ncbi:MAG: helix-turn-helix domain-containing protein [Treponema sp.]|nr:helix-turn-helix domain-containing protein [Treponema sp.]MCL2251358.1 helix-turn-helix domain-containing protein [Treponema sp.]
MSILNIISIVCFAFCIVMFFYLKWYIKKRTSGSELMNGTGFDDKYKEEIFRFISDIDRITDRDSQVIEERIRKLNSIIEEADKRIAVYVKELEKSKNSETLYKSLGRGIREALYNPSDAEVEYPQDSIEISNFQSNENSPPAFPITYKPPIPNFKEAAQQAAANIEGMNPPVPQSHAAGASAEVASATQPLSKQQIRLQIDLLIDEGLPPEEIASRLGISTAEVNLALNLRRK